MLLRGLEAINFIHNSNLAKRLTHVFQEAIDYRNNLEFAEDEDDISPKRIDRVYKFITRETLPKFQKAVLEETNLEITKITTTGKQQLTGFFAVSLAFDDLDDAITILEHQTGDTRDISKTFSDSVKEMQTMTEYFDTKTSKLSTNVYGKDKKRKIKCEMYMDTMMAFLVHDFINVNICAPFTAEELAAIYLHEIGHVLTVVERSNHLYSVVLRETKHIQSIKNNPDKKKAFEEFVQTAKPTLTELKENKKLDPKLADTMLKVLDTGTYLLEQEGENIIFPIIGFVFVFIEHLLVLISTIIINVYLMFLLGELIEGLTGEFAYGTDGLKSSDLAKSKHNLYQLERLADEYVSRHGMDGHLSSGLNKINDLFKFMAISGNSCLTSYNKSKTYYLYLCVITKLHALLGGTLCFTHNYEPQLSRLERLAQNARAAFKNDLNLKQLDFYINNYEKIQREIKVCKTKYTSRTADFIYKYLIQYIQPTHVLASLLTARSFNDHEKQQKLLDELINNELYFISAKFKQLANKS